MVKPRLNVDAKFAHMNGVLLRRALSKELVALNVREE